MKTKKNFAVILFILLTSTTAVFFFFHNSIISYTILFIASSFLFFLFSISLKYIQISTKQLYLFVLISLFLKLSFYSTEPIGSDDYYRYIWDGKVHSNEINPFLYQPNSPELNHLHSELLPEKVSFPHIKTIYFPVSQWIFVIAYWISGENGIGLKIFYLLFELLILVSLYFLLKRFSIDTKYILIYASMPLITFQFFIDAHIDIVGVALMLLSITLYFYNRKLLSYIFLGLSVSVKPTGFLLILFFFQNEIDFKDKIKSILIPISVFLITFIPYIFTATPIDTLINYSVNWTFNGMIYNTLNIFINDNFTIRIICGILFLLVFLSLFFVRMELINKIYLSLFLLMIFSPVVHPWYLIWFAVLLPVVQSYAGVYFVSAVSLTFITVVTYQTIGVWQELSWTLLLQYVPLLIIFIYELKTKKFNQLSI